MHHHAWVNQTFPNWKCLQQMFQMAFEPKLLSLLDRMKVTLIACEGKAHFCTSDQPVALYHPSARAGQLYAGALIDRDIQVALPLSRNRLLLLSWKKDAPAERQADASEVDEFNRRTAIMSSSYLFAQRADDKLLGIIRDNRKRFAGIGNPKMIELGRGKLQLMSFEPVLAAERYL